ncbi:hypothetical protein [Lactobacillus apis]|uniref:hypothetical protein n=1 Tax=Lactobacillus apis TaxID=303541 RepID=UPI00242BDBAE|nr:hypothetical protein [Lactobacillus apis]
MAKIKTPEEFYQDFKRIFAPDATGLNHLKIITQKLFSIIESACQVNADRTASLIAAWTMGTRENPNLENRSSYDAYITQHKELRKYLKNGVDVGYLSKDLLAYLFISDFQSSFELDKKILVNIVCIDRLLHSQDYSLEEIYFESAGNLINRLKQSNTDWDFLLDCMDKKIRNASSHLNFYYNSKDEIYIGKDIDVRNKQIIIFKVTPEKLLKKLIPQQSNMIQAFIACGILLWLSVNDKNIYNKAISLLH